ncbi:MAG: DUF2029 domain-containing protein [Promethearchaeota archaeon]|nr:MAG: DUF2029 domain-containing protein [Candidatus Lokiarchaeota archaeon]
MDFQDFKKIFEKLISNKYIKIGFIINFIFLIPTFISYIIQLNNPDIGNDFVVFYKAGKIALTNINDLYNPELYPQNFRYLPFTAYIFSLLTLFPEPISFVCFEIFIFLLNIPTIIIIYYLIFEIYKIDKKYEEYVFLVLTSYLLFAPHLDNYFMGQINSIVAFLLLLSLYFYELNIYNFNKKNKNVSKYSNIYGGFCLGLAITFKFYLVFLVPFILIYRGLMNNQKTNKMKGVLKFNIQSFLGLIPIIFAHIFPILIYPQLINDFITINLQGFSIEEAIYSISISRLVLHSLLIFNINVSGTLIMLSIFIPLFLILFYLYYRKWSSQKILPEIFTIVILFLFLTYLDIWTHHLPIIAPFLSLFLIRLNGSIESKKDENKIFKNFTNLDYQQIKYAYILIALNLWALVPFLINNFICPDIYITNFVYSLLLVIIFIKMIIKL